jgi:hypothetical protein
MNVLIQDGVCEIRTFCVYDTHCPRFQRNMPRLSNKMRRTGILLRAFSFCWALVFRFVIFKQCNDVYSCEDDQTVSVDLMPIFSFIHSCPRMGQCFGNDK